MTVIALLLLVPGTFAPLVLRRGPPQEVDTLGRQRSEAGVEPLTNGSAARTGAAVEDQAVSGHNENRGVSIDVREDVLSGAVERDGALMLPLDTIQLPHATPTTWFVLEHLDDDTWPNPVLGSCRPPVCPVKLQTRDQPRVVLFDRATISERCQEGATSDTFTGPLNGVVHDNHVDPVVLMIPDGPQSVVTKAGYEISVNDDLNVFWVCGEHDEPLLEEAFRETSTILAQAMIEIGNVRNIEVAGGLPEAGATFESADARGAGFCSIETFNGVHAEQPALFRLSAGAGSAASHERVERLCLRTTARHPRVPAGA